MERKDHRDALLISQPDGQDVMLRYIRRGGVAQMLTINISDLPDGNYKLVIESVEGRGLPSCEGALELTLDRKLKNPKIKQLENREGYIRTNRAYAVMGHPISENKPVKLKVIDVSKLK